MGDSTSDLSAAAFMRETLVSRYAEAITAMGRASRFSDAALVKAGDLEIVAAMVADSVGVHPLAVHDLLRAVSNARVLAPQYFHPASAAFAASLNENDYDT